jgi:Bacterial transcriptional activator domain/AAA ATPase domain
MLALYRDGNQAAALAAFQAARVALVAELGCEPGPALRGLQQQILSADPALAAPEQPAAADGRSAGAADGPGSAASPAIPRQLPSAVPQFVGRSAELSALARLLDDPAAPRTVVISAISGTAGIGKTALAAYWAHRVAERFPDGQLHLNLRGFGPSGSAMKPASALRLILDSLGVPAERIPADPDAQAALYRSILAGQRMLILVDNARDPADILPLLPGGPGCLVLVTSRYQLTTSLPRTAHTCSLSASSPSMRQFSCWHIASDLNASWPSPQRPPSWPRCARGCRSH